MPKSKRNRVISLTATKKKQKELKSKLIEEVKKCTDDYERLFVFSYENMRNKNLQEVKNEWKSSRFFFGKNKVIGVGLGRGPEEEIRDDIHKISERMSGQRGLLFTNNTKEEVVKYFKLYAEPGFARTGATATETVKLDKGPLTQFSFSIEPRLRELGLTTSLNKGVVTLDKDEIVCEEGDVLTSDQAHILKLLGIEMAEFRFTIEAMWDRELGFKEFVPMPEKPSAKKRKQVPTKDKHSKAKKQRVEESEESEEEEDIEEDEEDEELEEN